MNYIARACMLTSLVLGLAGCASTPSNYYTLMPIDSDSPTIANRPDVGPYVLGDISVPADVDQTPLVVQERDGRLLLLEYDRWGAPVSGQLQNALTRILTEQVGFPPLQNLNISINDKRNTRVKVAVQSFDLVAGQYAQIAVAWQITFADSKKTISCYAQHREQVKPGVAELVLGQQKNVRKIGEEIALVLRQRAIPTGMNCQNS